MKLERTHIPLLIVLGAALFVCALQRFDLFRRLEWISYDWRMREAVRRQPALVSDKLGFVYINDETIALLSEGQLGTNLHVGLYWPRHVYGRLIREFKNQGARAVGLDVMFDQSRPYDAKVPFEGKLIESDQFLIRQMEQAGNVVLGTADVAPHPGFRDAAAALGDIATVRDSDGVLRRAHAFRDYRLWHPKILSSATINGWRLEQARVRTNRILFPKADGTFDTLPITDTGLFNPADLSGQQKEGGLFFLRAAYEDVRVWHMGVTMAAMDLGLDLAAAQIELDKGRIVLGGSNGVSRIIPVDQQARMLIEWTIPPNYPQLASRPLHAVLADDAKRETGVTPQRVFDGKLVIVGSMATGNDLTDRGATPLAHEDFLTANNWNVMNSVLTGRFIRQSSSWLSYVLIIVAAAAAGLLTWRLPPLWASGLITATALAYAFMAGMAFLHARYVLPVTVPIVALVLGHFALLSYQVFFEQGERRRIKTVFAKLVSPKVVHELLKAEGLSVRGARREVTVLFADVRGFTEITDSTHALAEEFAHHNKLSPAESEAYLDAQSQEVLKTVNLYLSAIADIVKQHDGTLDKYIGDCVMAFWGAPTPVFAHALAAVQAAIEIQRAIEKLNRRRTEENQRIERENQERAQRREPPQPLLQLLWLGTGINTGMMTVGLMGSDEHGLNYTVFGREVNLAARLESISGSGRILIGEGTYRALLRESPALAASCLELPSVSIKGFRDAVQVFEVAWKKEKPGPLAERADAQRAAL
ncbi:MAG TPA: adenylate/guanylate cyclase domain-containing protein [Verrucomicrobiae bacterium]|nr:adenylate/guanylate cyclase domain-containing protein [Verrucomicrobiae bacterium]